jgi:TonB family protein
MRITLLRLAAALATFGLGVTLATLWLGLSTPSDLHAYERESCRFGERVTLAPAVAPAAPLPPLGPVMSAPPAVETLKMETCEGSAAGRTVSGGVLNGKAVSKPAPPYPAVAREARASGMVVVQIAVDECGTVENATAVSGHPLLRMAAVSAAYKARFAPTRIDGDPVKVTGTITYNFVLE